jgi:CelD/BcsL family acetyltransferase involved in cellulose biosynthesis
LAELRQFQFRTNQGADFPLSLSSRKVDAKLPGPYIIEEVRSTPGFLSLRDEWNTLVLEQANATVFQTWEWNFHVWKYSEAKSNKLHILLVREKKGSLIGIAPFYSYERFILGFRFRIVEFIGKNFTDYRDFIVRHDCTNLVYDEILVWLNQNETRWDIVDLQYVSEESHVVKNYNTLFRNFGFRTAIQRHSSCPYLSLRRDRDFYENIHSQSLVKQIKYKTRKLAKDFDYRFLTISSSLELEEYFGKFFELHRKRRDQKLQRGMFRSEEQEQLFTNLWSDLLGRGLRLCFLLIDNQAAACLCNFAFKNKIYSYQNGLDPRFAKYSLGYIIHSLAIREALKEGMEEYDFLLGSPDYKREWTEQYRTLYRIIISRGFRESIFTTNEKVLGFWRRQFRGSKLIRKIYGHMSRASSRARSVVRNLS